MKERSTCLINFIEIIKTFKTIHKDRKTFTKKIKWHKTGNTDSEIIIQFNVRKLYKYEKIVLSAYVFNEICFKIRKKM